MGKDRFSNQKRNNYEKSYLPYTPSVKRKLVFTKEQKIFIGGVLESNKQKLNSWEWDFLSSLYHSATYSERQKDTLKRLLKKIS